MAMTFDDWWEQHKKRCVDGAQHLRNGIVQFWETT